LYIDYIVGLYNNNKCKNNWPRLYRKGHLGHFLQESPRRTRREDSRILMSLPDIEEPVDGSIAIR